MTTDVIVYVYSIALFLLALTLAYCLGRLHERRVKTRVFDAYRAAVMEECARMAMVNAMYEAAERGVPCGRA